MQYFGNAGVFLVKIVFDFFIFLVLLRFLLQWTRADFYNPFSQFVVKVTNPVLRPLRKIIPGLFGLDMAALLLAIVLSFLQVFLMLMLNGSAGNALGILLLAIAEVLDTLKFIFIVAIFIEIIASWVAPHSGHPVVRLALSISSPLMRPARNLIPPMGGIDFSPIAVLIGLQLFGMLVIQPILDAGRALL